MCLFGCVLTIWERLIAVLLIKTVNAATSWLYHITHRECVLLSICATVFCPSLFAPSVCVCVAAVLVHHCLSSSMC